jgi:hypothetical protein
MDHQGLKMKLVKEIEDVLKFEVCGNELYVLTSNAISNLNINSFEVNWTKQIEGYNFIIIQNELYVTSSKYPQTTTKFSKETGEIIEHKLDSIYHSPYSRKFRNENHLVVETNNIKSIYSISSTDGKMVKLMKYPEMKVSISTNDLNFISINKRTFKLVVSKSFEVLWEISLADLIEKGDRFQSWKYFVTKNELVAQLVETKSLQSYVISLDYKSGSLNWLIDGNLNPKLSNTKTFLLSQIGELSEIDSRTGKTIIKEDYSEIVTSTINSCDGDYNISAEVLILKNSNSPSFLIIDRKNGSYMVSNDKSGFKFGNNESPIKHNNYILANYRIPNNHLKVYKLNE